MGNVFSFMFTKYPPDWRWVSLKVCLCLLAVACGLVVGKTIIHGLLLSRFLRLKMFRADQVEGKVAGFFSNFPTVQDSQLIKATCEQRSHLKVRKILPLIMWPP